MNDVEGVSPRKKRIVSSLALGFGAEIINKISPLIVLSLAQKRLGLGSLGSSLFALSIIEITIPFIIFGYTYYGALRLPKIRNDQAAESELVSDILFLRIFHAALSTLVLIGCTRFIASWHEHADILLKLLPFLFIAAIDMTYVNIGSQRMGQLSVWVGAFKLVNLLLVYLFVHGPSDSDLFAIFMSISGAGVSICSAVWIVSRVKIKVPSWSKALKLMTQVVGYAGIVFLYPLFERFDVLIIERYVSAESLGLYTGPWRLVMAIVPLFMVVASTYLAENVVHQSFEELSKGAHQALFLSLALTVPIAAASPFVAGDILSFVFDESLRASQGLFNVFTLSILAEVFVVIWGMQVLLLQGQLRSLGFALGLGIIIGSLSAYFLQRGYGAIGGALGALIGRWVTVCVIALRLVPLIRLLPIRDYFKVVLSAGIMALGLYSMPQYWPLIVRIIMGGLVYLVCIAAMNYAQLQTFLRRR